MDALTGKKLASYAHGPKLRSLFLLSILMSAVPMNTSAKTKPPADAGFLDQFTEHHKDAVKMGELALSKAANPEVKNMARRMISGQKEEIAQMKKWRERFFSSVPEAKSEMPKMDMASLKEKAGNEFDLAFLDLMVKHHEQGINMAKRASEKLFNPDIKAFAQSAIMNQDRERQDLSQMKKQEEKR